MYKPTTNPSPTLTAANQLGLLADKKMTKGNGNIVAAVNSMLTNASRARDRSDPYSWSDYASEMANGTTTASGAVGALTFGAGLIVSSPVLTTIGTVTGAVGALQFAYKSIKNRIR